METHTKKRTLEEFVQEYSTPLSIFGAGALIALTIVYSSPSRNVANVTATPDAKAIAGLQESVIPSAGITLPITWGDLGQKLVEVGAIDPAKMEALYKDRGGFPDEFRNMIEKNASGKIVMTNQNASYLLNLLWALGLANKNPILADTNEMMNPAYKGAGNFASTGGWTLSKGKPMDHYNMHPLVVLTADQQAIVDRVSRNIYRPCCGNSTHFPDCNHGMAMLGLLELMASQGVGEQDMYTTALAVNSYWFPETYLTIATYIQQKGTAWKNVSPKEMLSAAYSSSSGYQSVTSKVTNLPQVQGGGGCSA